MVTSLVSGLERSRARLILAHGAGAPMTSPFLEAMAHALAEVNVATVRFEFGYMADRRNAGPRRPPPPVAQLCGEYRAFVADQRLYPGQRLAIGGKSMGGRVASMIAGELYDAGAIAGLVVIGYPFHPPRKPHALRTAHLETLAAPTLIVQGTRDLLGGAELMPRVSLSPAIEIAWMPDGDHDLIPRRRSGLTQTQHIGAAARAIARFMGVGEAIKGSSPRPSDVG